MFPTLSQRLFRVSLVNGIKRLKCIIRIHSARNCSSSADIVVATQFLRNRVTLGITSASILVNVPSLAQSVRKHSPRVVIWAAT